MQRVLTARFMHETNHAHFLRESGLRRLDRYPLHREQRPLCRILRRRRVRGALLHLHQLVSDAGKPAWGRCPPRYSAESRTEFAEDSSPEGGGFELPVPPGDTLRFRLAQGLVSRASPVQTAVRNCTRDEGGPFGFGDQVADPKPPQAAVVKSHGGERCGNAGTMIPAGTVERGERKRTVSEVSKAD